MKKTTNFLIAVAISSICMAAQADSHCDQMVPYGYPTVSNKTDVTPLCRIAYTVLHDNNRKVPVYSAELLVIENIAKKVPRVNAFKADPDLIPGRRAELTDYDRAYDRGHMTPFEDARKNSAAALQTFYLSNMVPQNLHLNRGLWRSIENRTRTWAANSKNGIYVITGPIFSGVTQIIGDGVNVPTHLYKVIINKDAQQSIAFIVPNTGPAKGVKPDTYEVTVSEVEKVTGINFTPTSNNSMLKREIGVSFN